MVVKSLVRKNEYRDSIFLMYISKKIEEFGGVQKASAIMATDANKELLGDASMLTDEIKGANSCDLVIVIDAVSSEHASEAISKTEKILTEEAIKRVEEAEVIYKTLDSAISAEPESNLVLISVPGEFATREAERALKAGKHVMIFSDGVPLEDEVRLKHLGREKGLLVMGPDCGTAIINGIGLGFANIVKRGPVGIVAASGTGAQEVSSLINAGPGISHVIGTGGRDLHERVGGITMLMGLQILADDLGTEAIVLISKPPSPEVAKHIFKTASECGKPTVVNFLGGDPKIIEGINLTLAVTLEDAAAKAIALQRGEEPKDVTFSADLNEVKNTAEKEYERIGPNQHYIRGIYSGGTFCSEAMLIARDLVGSVYSNVPLKLDPKLKDSNKSKEHTFVDMGADEFTAEIGKPHPMIYHELRQKRILQEASDPETALLLFDVVLGYGAHEDPAGVLAPTLREAKEIAEREGRYLPIVASVCGTLQDPQNLTAQEKKLKDAGVVIMPSNAQAVRMATLIATRGGAWNKIVGR